MQKKETETKSEFIERDVMRLHSGIHHIEQCAQTVRDLITANYNGPDAIACLSSIIGTCERLLEQRYDH